MNRSLILAVAVGIVYGVLGTAAYVVLSDAQTANQQITFTTNERHQP